MIEVQIQNETHQTEHTIRFAAVPRIGEGIRLREPDGCWASYDVLDLWYQKADYGDVWVPYLHVCMTPSDKAALAPPAPAPRPLGDTMHGEERPVYGEEEFVSFTA
ncbi:MAG: hypothetical protein ACEQR8_01020 [Cypionkella sp.]